MIVTIAVGIQDRPTTAPQGDIWVSNYKLIGHPSFEKAVSAVSSIIFAYCGTPGELIYIYIYIYIYIFILFYFIYLFIFIFIFIFILSGLEKYERQDG